MSVPCSGGARPSPRGGVVGVIFQDVCDLVDFLSYDEQRRFQRDQLFLACAPWALAGAELDRCPTSALMCAAACCSEGLCSVTGKPLQPSVVLSARCASHQPFPFNPLLPLTLRCSPHRQHTVGSYFSDNLAIVWGTETMSPLI